MNWLAALGSLWGGIVRKVLIPLVGSPAMLLFVTSHVISGSVFGVGASKRLSAVRWGVAQSMVMAWVLTLPAAGLVAALSYELLMLLGVGR